MSVQEIEGVTYGFEGARLTPQNAAQRLYKAGFVDAKILATAYAVMMGESGRYLRAFHHNLIRDIDGEIVLIDGHMTVRSTDLGFIQRNVIHTPAETIPANQVDSGLFVTALFDEHPELADGQLSSEIAWDLFQDRGWTPWYAHSNGSYKDGLPSACVAVGRFLAMVLCGDANIVKHNLP